MDLDKRYRWYTITIGPYKFTFRGLTRFELRGMGSKPTTYEADSYVLSRCVVGIHDWERMEAGVAQSVLERIFYYSGITEEGITWKEAIAWITDKETLAERVAVWMIPSCSIESLENADPFVYARLCIMGRWAFEQMTGQPVEVLIGEIPDVEDEDTGFINVSSRTKQGIPGQGEVAHNETVNVWKKPKAKK